MNEGASGTRARQSVVQGCGSAYAHPGRSQVIEVPDVSRFRVPKSPPEESRGLRHRSSVASTDEPNLRVSKYAQHGCRRLCCLRVVGQAQEDVGEVLHCSIELGCARHRVERNHWALRSAEL
jgi:hypothetical protein